MSTVVGSATGYLDLDISGFLAGLKTAQAEASRQSTSIAAKMSNGLSSAGKNLSSVGKSLTTKVTLPLIGLGGAIVKTGADFEAGMSKVKAISGASSDELERLSSKARQMGKDTKFSASESADAFTYMAMAGWDTEDMLNSIDGIMALSAADGLDLARTSDIVTDAMTAFGLAADGTTKIIKDGFEKEVSNATHFADVLAKSASSSNTNVEMLGESFKYVAPVAGALGYSIEDVSIALGTMANNGIKGSQAGTSLRKMLTNLAKPTDAVQGAMDRLGVSLDDGHGNMKSFREVMEDLRKGFGKSKIPQEEFTKEMNELNSALESGNITQKKYDKSVKLLIKRAYGAEGALKAQEAATLAGQTGMSGLLSIVNASDEDWNNLINNIDNADGTAKEMADTMLNNLSGQLTILKSNLQEAALQLNEELGPAMKKIVDKIQEWVQRFMELSPQQKEMVIKIAAISAAIGPLLLMFGKLLTASGQIIGVFTKIGPAIGTLKTGFLGLQTSLLNVKEGFLLAKAGMPGLGAEASGLGAALGGITAPIAAIIAAIAVLVAAFITLWKTNENFRKKITEIWNQIKETISKFCDGIVSRVNELGFNFESITDLLWTIWKNFCDLLAPVFEGVFQNIANTLEYITGVILGIIDIFIGIFTGDWKKAWKGVKEAFGATWKYITSTLQNILNILKNVLNVFLGWFGTSLGSIWTNIKSFFVNTWNSIIEGVKNFISSIITFFSELPGNIANFFASVWNSIVNFVAGLPAKAMEIGTNFVQVIIGFFKKLPYYIGYAIGAVLGILARAAMGWIKIFTVYLPKLIVTVIKFFKQLPGKIWNAIVGAISFIVKWASDMKTKAVDGVKSLISSTISFFKRLPGNIKNAISSAITNISSWAASMKDKASNGARDVVDNVISFFKKLPSKIYNAIKGAYSKVTTWGTNMLEKAKTAASDVVDGVVTAFKKLPGKIKKIGKQLVNGLWEGIKGAKDSLIDNIGGFCDGVVDGFTGFFDIHSPSKRTENVGENVALGLIKGINNKKANAKKSAEELSAIYVKTAEDKLATLKKRNKLSLEDEKRYWETIRKETQKGTKAYKEATKKIKEAKKSLNDALSKLNKAYEKDVDKVKKTLISDIKDVMKEYDSAVKERAGSLASSFGGLFEKFESQTENTKQSIIDNMKSQAQAAKEYDDVMDKLENRKAPEGLLSELREAGPKSLEDMKLLAQMTEKEWSEFTEAYQQKQKYALNRALDETDKQTYVNQITSLIKQANSDLNTLEKEYKKSLKAYGVKVKDTSKSIGKNIVAGLKSGIKSDYPDFLEYVKKQVNKITSTTKDALKIKSPSRVFAAIGDFITKGLGKGFLAGMVKVNKDVKDEVEGLADVDTSVDVGIGANYLNMLSMLKETCLELQNLFNSFDVSIRDVFKLISDNLTTLMEYLSALRVAYSLGEDIGYVGRDVTPRQPTNPSLVIDKNNPSNGDTFIFNSPKPIDEIEAARQMKKAKRDLAEGF